MGKDWESLGKLPGERPIWLACGLSKNQRQQRFATGRKDSPDGRICLNLALVVCAQKTLHHAHG